MICRNCGREFSDARTSCPYCGSSAQPKKNSFYNSPAFKKHNDTYNYSRDRKYFGFILGFFFGILGLLGLLACDDREEKSTFINGWSFAFVISIVLTIVFIAIIFGAVSCIGTRY